VPRCVVGARSRCDGGIAACAAAEMSMREGREADGLPEGERERDSHYQFSSNGSAAP